MKLFYFALYKGNIMRINNFKMNAFIFARGGSKGVPRKNIKKFNVKPLIAWTIELAIGMSVFDHVIVSTDSEEIAQTARAYGAETPFLRPAELASDNAPEKLAWRHAVDNIEPFDIFVSLPAIAPLRRAETVRHCIEVFREGNADTVITVTPCAHHPSFSMVNLDEEGYAHLLMPTRNPVLRRQDTISAYDMVPVCYVTTPSWIKTMERVLSGRVKPVIIDREEAIDIDTAFDFEVAAFFHARRTMRD